MITKDKISEIFCICDDFLKELSLEVEKKAVKAPKYHGCRKWKCTMSDAEIITTLISFHFNSYRNFKHYYLFNKNLFGKLYADKGLPTLF